MQLYLVCLALVFEAGNGIEHLLVSPASWQPLQLGALLLTQDWRNDVVVCYVVTD